MIVELEFLRKQMKRLCGKLALGEKNRNSINEYCIWV